MGIPILNHLLPRGLLIGLNVQPHSGTFLHVTLLLGMVARVLSSHPLLTKTLLDMVSWFQLFHQTTLRISVIILAIRYVVSLLNVDTEFP